MMELIQALSVLSMAAALALICWCAGRQDRRRQAQREAEQAARLAAAEEQRRADWLDMCRQMLAVEDDFREEGQQ